MATEKPRFSITLDEDLLGRVEDYRHENKISTRSKAVVQLVEKGINELLKAEAAEIKKAPSIRDEALLNYFGQLNEQGQNMVVDYARLLVVSGEHSKNSADKPV